MPPPWSEALFKALTSRSPDIISLLDEQGRLLRPGAVATAQHRYQAKPGGWTWMEAVSSNQLHDPDVRGVVATSREISERKQGEEALLLNGPSGGATVRARVPISPLDSDW